jgi:hypothetical protein
MAVSAPSAISVASVGPTTPRDKLTLIDDLFVEHMIGGRGFAHILDRTQLEEAIRLLPDDKRVFAQQLFSEVYGLQ